MSIATQDPQVVTELLFIYTVYIYSFLICLQEPIAPILAKSNIKIAPRNIEEQRPI